LLGREPKLVRGLACIIKDHTPAKIKRLRRTGGLRTFSITLPVSVWGACVRGHSEMWSWSLARLAGFLYILKLKFNFIFI